MDDACRTKAQLIEELARLRREAEETLRESRAELQAIYDRMGDGVLVADAETRRFVRANPAICRMLGYSRDELLALSVDDIHPPEHLPRVLEQFAEMASGRTPVARDVPCLRKDGAVFYADVAGTPLLFEERGWVVAILHDVTERRAAEEALRRSEEQYRLLFEQSVDGIVVVGADGRIASANAAMCFIVARPQDEVVGSDVLSHIYPEDIHLVRKRYDLLMSGAAPLPGQAYRLVRSDGSPVWVEMRSRPLQWEGQPGFLVMARDITDRRQTEEALRRSEEQYRLLFEQSVDGIIVGGVGGGIVSANSAMCRILGRPQDEVVGSNVLSHIHPDDVHIARERADVLMSGMTPLPSQVYRLVRPDGIPVWVEMRSQRLQWEGRLGFLIMARDITDRRVAEEALRAGEARYRAVVETQTELICRFADGGFLTFVNEAYCRYFGKCREDLIGVSFLPTIPEADRDAVRKILASITRDHPVVTHEHRAILATGEVCWMHWTNRGIFDDAGRLVEVQAVGRDITDRRQAEEALRASEARYRAVVEDQTEMITRFTPDGTVTFVNEAICRFFGKTRGELLGHTFTPHVHPDDATLVAEAIGSLTPEHPVETHENRDVLSSGAVRWMQWTNRGIFDDAGRLVEVQAVGRDVTERRAAEEALRRSEEKYRALFEQNLDGVAVAADGRVISANPAFAAIHQRRVEDVPGMDPLDGVHPDDRQRAAARMREILAGRPGTAQANRYRLVRQDGSVTVIEVLARRIEWEGRPAVQGILRDVTERVRLEEELAEALKMEAVGQLAGGIAHDFNNLMTGILCHASLLKDGPGPPDDVREAAGLIEGAARRAAELTSQLLGFARRGKHRDVPVDVHAAVETTIRLVGRSLDPRIGVLTRFQGDRVFVRGDPVQVEQVVLNLALNARDAMPEGGRMTFATEVRRLDEAACAGRPQAHPGEYVALTVEDTGCGIPADCLGHIFEPFFTTKPQGRGTGMGLAMVDGIVRNHGGWVEVESAVGRGSTFRIFLPAVGGAAEPAQAAPGRVPAPAAAGVILVVDDEPLVREVTGRMLAALGYRTATAADGQEAVTYYRQHGRDVGLVVMDMVMPGMDGRECLEALRQLDPNVKVILSTGWGRENTVQDVLDKGAVWLVRKPYQVEHLAEAVQRALSG